MGNDNSKALKPAAVTDLNGPAYSEAFTSDQVLAWCKNQASKGNGGVTSKDGVRAAYGEVFPQGDEAAFAENGLAMFGADGGMVNIRALAAASAVAVRSGVAEDEKIKIAFDVFDIEGAGLLTKAEIKELLNAISKVVGKGNAIDANCDNVCGALDKDRDGKLSQSEFMVGCMSNVDFKAMFTS